MIDVSSIKELIRRWYPDKFHIISKKSDGHRAKEDLEESIKELTEYKNLFFK
jgi:oligoribonuclease